MLNKKQWKVECPTCEGTGQVVTGWNADAYENEESDCPDCAATGEIDVVPASAVEAVIVRLSPRRNQIQGRAEIANAAGDANTYGYGLLCGQSLAYGCALYHLRKILESE